MRKYHRLTREERYQIAVLKKSGKSIRKIASLLRREPSSISRELGRNGSFNDRGASYVAWKAHDQASLRRVGIGPRRKITPKLMEAIKAALLRQWSPEQISGRLAMLNIHISHETIYQFIYRDCLKGGDLYLCLRRKRKRRRSRAAAKNLKNVGKRSYSNWIDKRPKIVDKRIRLGDLERDTVLGKFLGPVLLTIVDRTSRLSRIAKIKGIDSKSAHQATLRLLKGQGVKTLTNDNGPEFALHSLTAKRLKAKVYFNHPYSSWQRGTNEHINGLIRQYYPKGTDFTKVSAREIKKLEALLNHRPRKCLGFKTPLEVHNRMSRASVALST
jgi:IS30 family transposase